MCDHYIIYVYRQLSETCVASQHGVPSIPRHGWSSCSAWNSGINPSCFNVPHHFFGAQSSFFLAIWLCIRRQKKQAGEAAAAAWVQTPQSGGFARTWGLAFFWHLQTMPILIHIILAEQYFRQLHVFFVNSKGHWSDLGGTSSPHITTYGKPWHFTIQFAAAMNPWGLGCIRLNPLPMLETPVRPCLLPW